MMRVTIRRIYTFMNASCSPLSEWFDLPGKAAALDGRQEDSECWNEVAKGGIEPPTQGFSVLCSTN